MKKSIVPNVGRRKTAIARALVKPGSGSIVVNQKPLEEYFGRATLQMIVRQPIETLKAAGIGDVEKFDYSIRVHGGGPAAQAGAVRLGIARFLVKNFPDSKKELRSFGLLTRDSREVERKKYGHHKARRRPQFSKR
jgi:small subunit ribosomal protein S9